MQPHKLKLGWCFPNDKLLVRHAYNKKNTKLSEIDMWSTELATCLAEPKHFEWPGVGSGSETSLTGHISRDPAHASRMWTVPRLREAFEFEDPFWHPSESAEGLHRGHFDFSWCRRLSMASASATAAPRGVPRPALREWFRCDTQPHNEAEPQAYSEDHSGEGGQGQNFLVTIRWRHSKWI
jgi:hypothetical protein